MDHLRPVRAALAVLITAISGAHPAVAQSGQLAPPSTTVTSNIGMMNELQKRGPYARVYGPDAGGRYLIVGPLPPTAPRYYTPRRHHRYRHVR